MKRKSNQRITKIKIDKIEELLKQAELVDVKDACVIQENGSDLTPYPDLNRLRIWTHNYLLSGITKIFANPSKSNTDDTYTVLIDGFPLYTKLTKSLEPIDSNSSTDSDTTTDLPPITDLESYQYYYGYYSDSPVVTNNSNSIVIPSSLHVKTPKGDLTLSDQITYTYSFSTDRYVLIYNSNDYWNCYQLVFSDTKPTNSTGEQIAWFNSSDNTWNIISSSNSVTSLANDYVTPIALVKQSSSTVTSIETDQFKIQEYTPPVVSTFETTKPGLWLSNLLVPVSESQAGSWLCHNLINSNKDSYSSINADTFGNYCYSFIQRGLFYKKSDVSTTFTECNKNPVYGDLHNLQWSPSASSCVAYNTLYRPNAEGMAFGNVYSTYQTLITPADPDMQTYTEDNSKCFNFNHISPTSLTSIPYSSRLVGKDWSMDLKFTPNGNGSGNDYGNGDDPEADNGSNGGCVTGTITSTIINSEGNEEVCIQTINDCFQTDQSYFNDNVPESQNDNPLGDDWISGQFYDNTGFIQTFSVGFGVSGYDVIISPKVNSCVKGFKGFTFSSADNAKVGTSFQNVGYGDYHYGGNCGNYVSWPRGVYDTDECGFTCFISGQLYPGTKYKYRKHKDLEPETGVNIYLNITDLKAEAEAKGLPWDNSSCSTRFSTDISTTPCSEPWCTSKIIATNVDINELGDISKLVGKVFN